MFGAMPTFRPDLASLKVYVPGRSVAEVAAEIGLSPDEIVKLASNESPYGPFPGVAEAVERALAVSNRYPEDVATDLARAVAEYVGVPIDHLWFGSGSVALLGHIALAVGGPGTSAVYGWPSFLMYRIISRWAMTLPIEVQLDDLHTYDLPAMGEAARADTTVVYICNPNNPSGTVVSGAAVSDFVASLPGSVLVVVDEAYHEFVSDPGYRSAVPLALDRQNVVVLRTFSKVFALAAHRIGYAVGRPETLSELKKTQAPFSVTTVAQAAATASLGRRDELARRIEDNAAGRHHLLGALAERGVVHVPSETNFIYTRFEDDAATAAAKFEGRGVIIRPVSRDWLRVTVGSEAENRRLVEVFDEIYPDA